MLGWPAAMPAGRQRARRQRLQRAADDAAGAHVRRQPGHPSRASKQRWAFVAERFGCFLIAYAVRIFVWMPIEQLPMPTAFRAVQVRSVEENDPGEGDPLRPHGDQCALVGHDFAAARRKRSVNSATGQES
jgi:hypothetical protein